MSGSGPDYSISKPSGSTLLIESRTPSSDVGGIIVTPMTGVTNATEISSAGTSDPGTGQLDESGDSGLGLRPPDSGLVEVEMGDGGEGTGDEREGVHDVRPHAGHYPRLRKRIRDMTWSLMCGGPRGRCKRTLCINRYSVNGID